MRKFFDKKWLVWGLILSLGLFLRLYRLEFVPARLTIDEMSIGYNAYSLIETGKDEWGSSWPLIFRAFGDYKLPAYIYGTLPFVYIFGLNLLSIRLLSVLSGMIVILGVGLIASKLFKNQAYGYMAALITAISPWPLFISRMGLESNLGLGFFCVALVLLLDIFNTKSKPYAYLAGIMLGLTWYTYIAFRLTTGLILLLLIIFSVLKTDWRKSTCRILISFLMVLLPLSPRIFDFSGQARFQQISVFSDQGSALEVNEDRTFCFLQDKKILPRICQTLYHKPATLINAVSKNYLQLFSPEFLFYEGSPDEYLGVGGFGSFYLILLPFYVWGIWLWINDKNVLMRFFGLIWLVSPLASALAGPAHIVRASGVILFAILSIVLGFFDILKKLSSGRWKRAGVFAITLIVIFSSLRFLVNYFFIYPAQFDAAAYPLPPELGQYLKENHNNFEKVYFGPIGPGLHIFTAYYLGYPPQQYQRDVVWPQPDKIGFTHPKYMGKFEFDTKSIDQVLAGSETKVLYVGLKLNDYPPARTFYNFSGVHPQAMIYNIDELRKYVKELKDRNEN